MFAPGSELHSIAANEQEQQDILDENTLPGTSVARDVPSQSEKGTEQDIAAGSIVRNERTQTMTKGGIKAPTAGSTTSGAASAVGASFSVGDRVLVSDTKHGTFQFLGPTQFAPGDWAGVVLDKEEGKNDGSVAGVRYFQCEPQHGIFARPAKLSKLGENGSASKRSSAGSHHVPSGSTAVKTTPLTTAALKAREGTKDVKSKISVRTPASSIRSLRLGTPSRPVRPVKQDFEIGDRVIVNGAKIGYARFVGETDFANGAWVGVELDGPQGKNDGSVQGKCYFKCEILYGLFAPLHKVKKLVPSTPRTTAEDVFEDEQPQGPGPAILEVSGGHHGKTYLGGQYGQYIVTQVNKTYNPVAASTKPQNPGQFQVSSLLTVYEKDPISPCSRIFKGSLHSDVTGDRDAAVKITAAQKYNYREAKIYFSVPHHKNIVERFATDTFNFRGQPSIFIAMERCDCDLYNHVISEVRDGVEFDVEKYTWIAYQILVGLDFLHSHDVVHGDFKPANVLLILNGNIVKLTDFGLSRAVTQGNSSTQLTSPQGGTIGWQAPEILEGTMRISVASDIFPCGLTLYFVWSHGKHAYGDRPVSLNHYIVEGTHQDLSRMLVPFVDDAKVLLNEMLQRDQTDRPSVREILQSQIFRRFGSVPVRAVDQQVVELIDQVFRFTNPRGAEAAILSEDPLTISATQLQTAMQSFLERNQKLIREPSICKGNLCSKLSDHLLQSDGGIWEIKEDKINLGKKLWSRNFGDVYKAKWWCGLDVAVKVIKEDDLDGKDNIQKEANVLKNLHHPNIVSLHGLVKTEPTWIVTEYMENGNLRDWLRKGQVPKTEHIKAARQIIDGMTYIADRNYVHRNLRAVNILVSATKEYKIANLGLARLMEDEAYVDATWAKFPAKWAAPEVIRFRNFSTKSDIWSFGVLLAEIATDGEEPYGDMAPGEVTKMVKNKKKMAMPGACSINWYRVMEDCWAFEPDDRPSFTELQKTFMSWREEGEPDSNAELVDQSGWTMV